MAQIPNTFGSFIPHLSPFHLMGIWWDDLSGTQHRWEGSQVRFPNPLLERSFKSVGEPNYLHPCIVLAVFLLQFLEFLFDICAIYAIYALENIERLTIETHRQACLSQYLSKSTKIFTNTMRSS